MKILKRKKRIIKKISRKEEANNVDREFRKIADNKVKYPHRRH